MTVLILGNAGSVHVQRWVNELEARGCRTWCLSFGASNLKRASKVPGRFPFNFLLAIGMYNYLLWRHRPRLVHCHYVMSYGLLGCFSYRRLPLFVSAWGSDILITAKRNAITRRIARFILQRSTCVFADSGQLGRSCAELSGDRDLAVTQVQWGVDLDKFNLPKAFTQSAARTFLSSRAHEPLYRVDRIIEAFAHARERIPSARLIIAGSGTLTPELVQLAADLKISAHVRFTGAVPEERLRELMYAADVSISIPRSDGTSVSVLESMATGLPVVCSDLEANREWLDDRGACIIPVKDVEHPESLARALIDFYEGRYALDRMGARNREVIVSRADRKFHFDRVVTRYAREF